MTQEPKTAQEPESPQSAGPRMSVLLRLPGLAAIALYMLVLAGTIILGVVTRHYPPLYLVFPVLFFAAGLGLLMVLRWAWALTVSAVALLMGLFGYEFALQHAPSAMIQGLLNLVFFFYLVRAEVRENLR